MIAIDTNVLLRYLLDDDKQQSARAAALMRQQAEILVTDVVLVETVWTLKGRKYRVDDPAIAVAVNALFAEPGIRFENDEVVWRALTDFMAAESEGSRPGRKARRKSVDFADALIINKARHCAEEAGRTLEAIYTFDAGALVMAPGLARALP